MKQTAKNDLIAAARAKRHGMHHALKIAQEARREKIPYDLAYAMVEQETGTGLNIFGHDPSIYRGAGQVTKKKYLAYKAARRASGNRRMQGVGLLQLTWWEFQDAADRMGGCWVPRIQLRYGFRTLRKLIDQHGYAKGIERYNGSGRAAEAYSRSVRAKRGKWTKRLNP
jgi:hypothetical protein